MIKFDPINSDVASSSKVFITFISMLIVLNQIMFVNMLHIYRIIIFYINPDAAHPLKFFSTFHYVLTVLIN